MLQTLSVRDLALVREAEIELGEGLNVISGETGGGKSLVITALKLLRGGKAAPGLVRHGADTLRVDAEFALGTGERSLAVGRLLDEECGLPVSLDDDGMLLVTRIVDARGRSKVRVNDRPTTLATLRTLGAWLLEIHGQGDARALMRPEIQAETLDAFLGTGALRQRFARALREARRLRAQLAEATSGQRDRLARVEYLRYQLAELDELALQPGELAAIEQEQRVLGNLDHLRSLLEGALGALDEAEPSAGDQLASARRAVDEAASIDADLNVAVEALADAEVQIAEAVRAVQSRMGRLELDPGRLAEVEERLAALRRGLQRFGPTEADLLDNAERARDELGELERGELAPEEMAAEVARATDSAVRLARQLVRARAKGAPRLARAVEAELADLAMPKTEFRVAMSTDVDADALLDQATAHGPGPIDFEVRLNPGEPFHSMQKTASGGEMARIVLAMKKCLADQDRVPFLVFDEIDAEIGGRLGLAVGGKLRDVARHHQVLIVTHLPQVAAFAQRHFAVTKIERAGRTLSQIQPLDGDGVERELAAMAVGEGADAAAIAEARRLVARTQEGGA